MGRFLNRLLLPIGVFLALSVSSSFWRSYILTGGLWIFFWIDLWRPFVLTVANVTEDLERRVAALERRLDKLERYGKHEDF